MNRTRTLTYWASQVLPHCRPLEKFTLVSSSVSQLAKLRLGRQVSQMRNLVDAPLKFETTIERYSYKLRADAKEVLILSANGSSKMWIWHAEGGKGLTWQ